MHRHGELLGSWKVRVSQKLSVPTKPERVGGRRCCCSAQDTALTAGAGGKCRLWKPHAICATCYASGEQMWTGTTWKTSIFVSFAQWLSVCTRCTARESGLRLRTSNSEKQSQRGGLSPCRNDPFCFLERTRSSVPTSDLPERLDCLIKCYKSKQSGHIWSKAYFWGFIFGGEGYVYWSQSQVCCIQCTLIKQTPLKNCMLSAHAQKLHTSSCIERWDFTLAYLQKCNM